MKIRIALFLPLFILTSLSAQAYFTDIQKDSLDYLYEKEIFQGYQDGSFGPENSLTRAELIKIVLEGTNHQLIATDLNCFSDITPEHWSAAYVCTAKDLEYINGYEDGSYKPDQSVNKVEAIKMIAEVMKWKMDPNLVLEDHMSFDDTPQTEWYYKYVSNGVTLGYLDLNVYRTFEPAGEITREMAAETLFRTMVSQKMNNGDGVHRLNSEGLDVLTADFFTAYQAAKNMTPQDFTQIKEYNGTVYGFDYDSVEGIQMPKSSVKDPQDFFFLAKYQPEADSLEDVDFFYPRPQADDPNYCSHYLFELIDPNGVVINQYQAEKVCQDYEIIKSWTFDLDLELVN